MSDEYTEDNIAFSPFWPLLILLAGLVIWLSYQVYEANSLRSAYAQQFQAAIPTINQAQAVQDRYVKLMKDLIETSSKDASAAQIVKEATQAGLIRQAPPAAGAAPADGSTPPPAPADASSAK